MVPLSRRAFMGAVSLSALATLKGRAADTRRPDIVVFVADDLGHRDLGAYGHPHIKTPATDALAREGILFSSAFLTTSSCSPSRASVLTGMYPHSTGAGELHLPLPKSARLLTTPLRERGYWTAAAGKWHLGKAVRGQFDRIEGGGPSGGESWVQVIEQAPKDKPCFLWLAAVDPHRPYAEDTIPTPHRRENVVVPPFLPDTPAVRDDLADYYDEVTRFDSNVGKAMDALAREHRLENTVIVLFSDNGRPFPRCKTTLYDSGIATPLIVRMPGGQRAGTTCAALTSTVDLAATLLELAGAEPLPDTQGKSFVALLRDPTRSYRDYIYAEHNWHDYAARERAVRSKRYLYIRNDYPDVPRTPPADAVRSPTFRAMQAQWREGTLPEIQAGPFIQPAPREELYDVAQDPHNLHNLAQDESHGETLKRMAAALDAWQQKTGDRQPEERRPDQFDRTSGDPLK